MKKVYLLSLLFLFSLNLLAQEPFITTWQTKFNNESITIPTRGGGYSYSVDWGDGHSDAELTGDATHEYDTAGVYTVSIIGEFPRISFLNRISVDDIRSIEQWGDIKWDNFLYAFWNCESLVYNATDAPDLSNVVNLSHMFDDAESFDGDLSNWDITTIQSMKDMFLGTQMSLQNYDKTLQGWASQTGLQSNVELGAQNKLYCEAEEARNKLIADFNWNIVGDAKICSGTTVPFITKWKTSFPNQKITIPIEGWSDYSVDWGDGTITNDHNGPASHTYADEGVYTIEISGIFPVLRFYYRQSESIKESILSIEQWGDMQWFGFSFYQCPNVTLNATDVPDLSEARSLVAAFLGADSFNGDLSKWDVSNVTSMAGMFYGADSFNGDLSQWDVSNVVDMQLMFANADSFNGDISSWNVRKVTDMYSMFRSNSYFNGDISNWDVREVKDMSFMFSGATVFNRDLGSWNVTNVTYMRYMFDGSAISLQNYDSILNGWGKLSTLKENVELGAGGLYYCAGETGRNTLINDYGWTINDEGKDCRFQRIVFGPFKEKTYGDEDFSIDAYATSALPVEFYSSNEEVASIDDNTVTIVGAGVTNIVITQEGNENYDAADTLIRELIVLKASQTISFDSIPEKTTDDHGFIAEAEASSELKVVFTSSNLEVSTIKEDSILIAGAGQSKIIASQEGNENYKSADSVSRELVVLEGVVTALRSHETLTINIFPNPTHDVLHLQKLEAVSKVSVYSSGGKLLEVYRVPNNEHQIDLKDKPNGIYYIRLDYQNEVFKILKN